MKEIDIILEKQSVAIELTLEYVFDYFDDLLMAGGYDVCDKILDRIDVSEFDFEVLLGILTVTNQHEEHISDSRSRFADRCVQFFSDELGEDEAKSVLIGLVK